MQYEGCASTDYVVVRNVCDLVLDHPELVIMRRHWMGVVILQCFLLLAAPKHTFLDTLVFF